MNKKLLAAAVAAAVVAAPAAFAESTVYGKMHTSIDNIEKSTGGVTDEDFYDVNSRSSRLGFKGSEDLGNGLKAIYQIELQIDTTGGPLHTQSSKQPFDAYRNTFVGLSGDFGTFLVGRHDTPAKMAFYAAGTDILGDSIIDLNGQGGFEEFRANGAIAYVSPNFSGFTVAAAVIPGGQHGVADTAGSSPTVTLPSGTLLSGSVPPNAYNNDGFADHWSLGLMYSGNGLKAGVGYESKVGLSEELGDPEADYDTLQVGVSYTMNNFMVGAHYEDSDDNNFVAGDEFEAWGLVAKATFGNNAIMAIYTDNETTNSGAVGSAKSLESDSWGLAAEHNFSKRTKVYAAYTQKETDNNLNPSANKEDDRFSLGMIHSF